MTKPQQALTFRIALALKALAARGRADADAMIDDGDEFQKREARQLRIACNWIDRITEDVNE